MAAACYAFYAYNVVVRQFRRLNVGHRQVVRELMLSLLKIERRK